MRKTTIGVCSYRNAEKLAATLESIQRHSTTDWRLVIVHNPADGDEDARGVITRAVFANDRISVVWNDTNEGYAGAVNRLKYDCRTRYLLYCDNDVEIRTHGWDEKLCEVMDQHDRVAWVFPGAGHYGFFNGAYHECLWNAGYCWAMRVAAQGIGNGYFDTALGHHEEVDYMIRLRLAGYRIAARPDVHVIHHETATRSDDALHKPGGRIHDGVVRWMNKWNNYFCGGELEYSMTKYDPRALRYTDWPPCALYLERWTLAQFPQWNAQVEQVQTQAGVMDAVKVLKPHGPYAGRAI